MIDITKMSAGDFAVAIEQLPVEDKDELIVLCQALNEKLYYQMNPLEYFEDKLGIPKQTIKWSLNPEYEALDDGPRVMDDGTVLENGWDGTRDPLYTAIDSLAMWKDVVVQSSTGTGKTFLAALVTLWFLDVFPNSKYLRLLLKKTS